MIQGEGAKMHNLLFDTFHKNAFQLNAMTDLGLLW